MSLHYYRFQRLCHLFGLLLCTLCLPLNNQFCHAASDEVNVEKAQLYLQQNPGIVVCEPVPQNADEDTTHFGAGCARWLFWTVGGLPQMGSSPTWHEVNRAEGRLKREDLRLNPDEARRLVRYLGVNRIATGTVSGDAANCTLTYQLHHATIPASQELPTLIAQGAPLQAKGTYEQVIAALPRLARELAKRAGVVDPSIPEAVGANAVSLVLVGQAQTAGSIAPEKRDLFLRLAGEFPLANLMVGLYDNNAPDFEQRLSAHAYSVRTFLLQSPENTLGWSVFEAPGEEDYDRYQKLLLQYQTQHANNYHLATAFVKWKIFDDDYASAYEGADKAVECAPLNPYAHLLLADTVSDYANSVRQGRFMNRMDPKEQATVRALYPRWVEAALSAVNRDTSHSQAWLELSKALAFNSNRGATEEALWKAIETDANNLEAYSWGLQIFQPKWYRDDAKLWKTVQAIMADESRLLALYEQIFAAFSASPGQQKNAVEVRAKTMAALEKVLLQAPEHAELHFQLGKMLLEDYLSPESEDKQFNGVDKLRKSQEHLERAVALENDYGQAHFQLGYALMSGFKPDHKRAAVALMRAAELDPKWDEPAAKLGELFELTKDYAASEKWWRRAIRITPASGAFYSELAYVVLLQNRREEAVKLAEQAKKLGWAVGPVFEELQAVQPTPAGG